LTEKENKCSAAAEMGDRARAKWTENWGLLCLASFREGAGSPSNTMWPGPRRTSYLRSKWQLDLSNRLATIHQHHRHERTDRQNGPL